MTGARVLRAVAIAIAIAGVADPALTREMGVPEPLAIVMTSAAGTGSAQRLKSMLAEEYDVSAYTLDVPVTSAACPTHGGCVLVSDGSVPRRLSAGAVVVGAVGLPRPNDAVVISGVHGPPSVDVAATASLRVRVEGPASRIDVLDDNVLVGSASVTGATAGGDVPVQWVPLTTGPRRLTVRAGAAAAEVGVVVTDDSTAVLFYEPEATWLGTFVRRALEDDSRFVVAGRTRVAPPIAVTRRGIGQLTGEALGGVGVVVVSAPHALSSAETELLERFVRVRGGSVVLLLDRRPEGQVLRLLPAIASARRENKPIAIGPLQATEILSFDAPVPGTSVIEAEGGRAVVAVRAIGRGRVLASGALDAWRYRGASGDFKGFWTSIVADAAAAGGDSVNVALASSLVARGAVVSFTVEWRTMDPVPLQSSASALMTCGETKSIGRLWPAARPGVYSGTILAPAAGTCELAVSIAGTTQTGRAQLLIADVDSIVQTSALDSTLDPLVALTAAVGAHGGIVVTSGDEASMAMRVREFLPPARGPRPVHPMRSAWWMLAFTACLGGEWWLRRHAGLR